MGGNGKHFLQSLPFWSGVKWTCSFNPYRYGIKFSPSCTSRLGENLRAHNALHSASLEPSLLSTGMQGTKAREDWGGAASGVLGELLICFPHWAVLGILEAGVIYFLGFPGHRATETTRPGSSRQKPNSPVLSAANTLANSGYRLQMDFTTSPSLSPSTSSWEAGSKRSLWLPTPSPVTSKSLSRASQGKDSIKVPFCLLCFWPAVVDS